MDPISIGLSVVGLGMSLFGSSKAADEAEHQAQLSRQIGVQEQNINNQKYQQMMLTNKRQQMEVFRNVQRARAQGLNSATNQGAQFGSGLAGGQAQAVNQGDQNLLAMNQNVEMSKNIFDINNTISGIKGQMSDSQSAMAQDQGLASLGGALMKAGPTIGNLSQNAAGVFSDPLGGFGGSSRWGIGG